MRMEFKYKLSIWECFAYGVRGVFRRLFFKSKALRTVVMILAGSFILMNVIRAAESGRIGIVSMVIAVCLLAWLVFIVMLVWIPDEVRQIYRQWGKQPRFVRIVDGSMFVTEDGNVWEYWCRNIQEFVRCGRTYRILATGRMGRTAEIILPLRVIGDRQKQDEFRRYVNEQRKLSGDKLAAQGRRGDTMQPACEPESETASQAAFQTVLQIMPQIMPQTVPEAAAGRPGCIRQVWNLDKLTEAVTECQWIIGHYMMRRSLKDWADRFGVKPLLAAVIFVVCAKGAGFGWGFGIGLMALAFAYFLVRAFRQTRQVSMKSSRQMLEQYGAELYEETWELHFTSRGMERKIPLMETVWNWTDAGYLMETDAFFHFFTKEQRLMFYMEKELLGDWKAQKLFVQDCQAKGMQYQVIHPAIGRDVPSQDNLSPAKAPVLRVVQGTAEGERKTKNSRTRRIGRNQRGSRRGQQKIPDTQEGWRKFWAEKEKEHGGTDRLRIVVTVLAVIGIFLLAIFLPEFERSPGLGVYPEAYENYTPLAEQVETLEKLGFTVPQEIVDGMNANMKEWPESRVWVEGNPYTGLLSAIGMPEWNPETWETTGYSEQAYWFDWEGFDMSSEYINILNGVNTMAGGEFTITDAKQEMSDADWERGTGDVYLRFCIDGKPYEYRLELMNDWLDTNIIKDINDALKKAGVEKRVYAMDDDGQGCILFYRDKEWAKQFKKATGIRLQTE